MVDVTAARHTWQDLDTMVVMPQMPTPSPQPSASTPMQVGPHELSVVGVVAISRTAACTRYAKDADRAPRMTARVDLLRMSAWEVASFDRVVELASTHGFGLLIDFGMALSESLEDPLRSGLVHELSQDPISTYAVAELEAVIAADPQLAARLGLWGRRVIGEEIGTFQRLLGQFPGLLGSMAQEQLHSVLSQGAVSRMRGLGLRV